MSQGARRLVPLPIWIEQAEPSGVHDTERIVLRIVDVDVEADPIDKELERSLDITHRKRNHID